MQLVSWYPLKFHQQGVISTLPDSPRSTCSYHWSLLTISLSNYAFQSLQNTSVEAAGCWDDLGEGLLALLKPCTADFELRIWDCPLVTWANDFITSGEDGLGYYQVRWICCVVCSQKWLSTVVGHNLPPTRVSGSVLGVMHTHPVWNINPKPCPFGFNRMQSSNPRIIPLCIFSKPSKSSSFLSTNSTTRYIEETSLPSPNLQQTHTVSWRACWQALRDKHRGARDVEMSTRQWSQVLIESRLSVYNVNSASPWYVVLLTASPHVNERLTV
jgi:hypothetical protein